MLFFMPYKGKMKLRGFFASVIGTTKHPPTQLEFGTELDFRAKSTISRVKKVLQNLLLLAKKLWFRAIHKKVSYSGISRSTTLVTMRSFIAFGIIIFLTSTSAWPAWRQDISDRSTDEFQKLISHLSNFEDALFGLPDNGTGARVAEWHEGMSVNPEELGSYVEGDILFPTRNGRNGLIATSTRWPGGVVPYTISPYFSRRERQLIYDAIADYHKYTCIRFTPYRGYEEDYIRIVESDSGCWSSVGRIGGPQDVNLQVPGCVQKKGTVIHELMHVIGFLHEQSRYERDDYVLIKWNNIKHGYDSNFCKASEESTSAFGVGYDYDSVMHYSAKAFSRNGEPTILIKDSTGEIAEENAQSRLGQRTGFSNADITKIQRMYGCTNRLSTFLQNLLFG